ncbi:unnamed protein product [Protopolystoma xenopodis]|uniref:Uncharacterized protein n=1 Tax=Protopolystoma xenopodis TaxID=117903 RepID=A0A448X4J9_9PLAT|nr:unnamed protein product [Protopolystoma xenopodis]
MESRHAFVRSCTFANGPALSAASLNLCTSSDWSIGFRADIPHAGISRRGDQPEASSDLINSHGAGGGGTGASRGSNLIIGLGGGNDLFTVAIVAVGIGLVLVAVVCIAFGCVMR